jgi:hypothetical protein
LFVLVLFTLRFSSGAILQTWSIGGISDSIGLDGFGAKDAWTAWGFSDAEADRLCNAQRYERTEACRIPELGRSARCQLRLGPRARSKRLHLKSDGV